MLIGKNEKIVFIGDSVTDCGRVRPVGEGLDHPYGQGYVRDVAGLLQSVYPVSYTHLPKPFWDPGRAGKKAPAAPRRVPKSDRETLSLIHI